MRQDGDVPAQWKDAHEAAERCVRRYFADQDIDRVNGTITIGGERYVLVRTEGIATEYFEDLVQIYSDAGPERARRTARGLLFDLGYKVGQTDARSLAEKIAGKDRTTRILAGAIQFAYTGGSRIGIHESSELDGTEEFALIYDLRSSFEADERRRHATKEEQPSCAISGGYLSGWCEAVLDRNVVATEILCRAKGDPVCRFVIARRDRIDGVVADHLAHEPELAERVDYYEIPRIGETQREREEMHGLVARLQEAQRTRSQMLKEIAHDVGTPVTSLYLQAYVLKRRAHEDPELAETVEILQESIGRLTQFVRDLKDVSAMEEGQTYIARQPVELLRVVERVLGLLRPTADEMGIGMQVTATGDTEVEGDPARLGQLVRILLSNALKFSQTGQEVRVNLRRAGDDVEVTVRDEGRGIDAKDIKRLFRPFEQVHDPATTPYKGSGLGLYIARWIVQEHGGRIFALSEGRGEGATFTFTMPALGTGERPQRAEETTLPTGGAGTTLEARRDRNLGEGADREVTRRNERPSPSG